MVMADKCVQNFKSISKKWLSYDIKHVKNRHVTSHVTSQEYIAGGNRTREKQTLFTSFRDITAIFRILLFTDFDTSKSV